MSSRRIRPAPSPSPHQTDCLTWFSPAADAWINERYFFLVHEANRPTLEWFLEIAEVAIIRHGVRIVQIDPWNRLEASRSPGEWVYA
jgi:hypothetical protein